MSRLLIQFSHLFKSFGSSFLFQNISLSIHKASHLELGFLPQEISLQSTEISVQAYLEASSRKTALSELEQQMISCLEEPDRVPEWAELHKAYEQLGGYLCRPKEKILKELKLDASLLVSSMASLSSGQRVRVALAKALIETPDLLLLDEPTNHLDAETLDWLETMLQTRKGATIIVSHNRKFLNATCNRLIEIKNGKLTCYSGNYDFYLQEKERLLDRQISAYQEREEEISFIQQKMKVMTFSKRKAPLPKDRNTMAYDKRGANHQRSLQRNLNVLKARLEKIESYPLTHPKPKNIQGLRFSHTPLNSVVAIEFEEVTKGFGEKRLFSGFTKRLSKGDRIILSGPNGSGKTTLFRCIAGLLSIDAGQIRYAPTTKIAYLDQEVAFLPIEQTPLQYFESKFSLSEEELRCALQQASLGSSELLNRPFSQLSVGQRKRLLLLSLLFEKPNVLLLDEPTNHLDLQTLEALETALLHFEDAVLAISHDSTFIEKIATQEWSLP